MKVGRSLLTRFSHKIKPHTERLLTSSFATVRLTVIVGLGMTLWISPSRSRPRTWTELAGMWNYFFGPILATFWVSCHRITQAVVASFGWWLSRRMTTRTAGPMRRSLKTKLGTIFKLFFPRGPREWVCFLMGARLAMGPSLLICLEPQMVRKSAFTLSIMAVRHGQMMVSSFGLTMLALDKHQEHARLEVPWFQQRRSQSRNQSRNQLLPRLKHPWPQLQLSTNAWHTATKLTWKHRTCGAAPETTTKAGV